MGTKAPMRENLSVNSRETKNNNKTLLQFAKMCYTLSMCLEICSREWRSVWKDRNRESR